jgi:hypothetical protein
VSTMSCLFRSEQGPGDAASEPTAACFAVGPNRAQTHGQLEATERQVLHTEIAQWHDRDYAWTSSPAVIGFFLAAFAFLILPWLAFRVFPAICRRFNTLPQGTLSEDSTSPLHHHRQPDQVHARPHRFASFRLLRRSPD